MVKAQVVTIAAATKQLGLSREVQGDATEMVRRAEFAEDKAMKNGPG